MRADVVVSLVKVRECRRCSQQYRAPMPVWATILIVLVGLAMMAWLGLRAAQVRLDRHQLLAQPAPIILAAVGAFVVLYGFFKLIFQRGIKPPERHTWRERVATLPADAPGVETRTPAALPTAPPLPPSKPERANDEPARKPVAPPPSPTPVRPISHPQGSPMPSAPVLAALRGGAVIPAHPLALTARRDFSERRMRGLTRYYLAAGAGGVAAAVHTTQFAIRKPKFNLLRPVLEVVIDEVKKHETRSGVPIVKIAGICGDTAQAVAEAGLAAQLGYDIGLISLSGLPPGADEFQLIDHCKQVARVLPIMGFYLQPAVGGRNLPFAFWRALADVPNVVGIKIAAFDRYRTIEVMRAIAESGRALNPGGYDNHPIAIYTGNDDHIVGDLLGDWSFDVNGSLVSQRIVGGLLGHWACWTRSAVDVFESLRRIGHNGSIPAEAALLARQITDMNGAVFDARHNFRGCIAGVNEVLVRQGLLESNLCLDPADSLSPGQAEEISRVMQAYPHLLDDAFVQQHLSAWLS